jgi:hypothetical protein
MASAFRSTDRKGALQTGATVRLKLESVGTIPSHDGENAYQAALGQFLGRLSVMPRPIIARLITHLIDHLDSIDGDCDFEDGDPDCEHDGREPKFSFRRIGEL